MFLGSICTEKKKIKLDSFWSHRLLRDLLSTFFPFSDIWIRMKTTDSALKLHYQRLLHVFQPFASSSPRKLVSLSPINVYQEKLVVAIMKTEKLSKTKLLVVLSAVHAQYVNSPGKLSMIAISSPEPALPLSSGTGNGRSGRIQHRNHKILVPV